VFGCSPARPSPSESAAGAAGTGNAACAATPSETAGPFPSLADFFRSDIRDGKSGTLLRLMVKVVDTNADCAAVPNANVEVWHVDAAGNYSQYGAQASQTFLRGIQTTNSDGEVSFTTIFPGWYQGRATHIHVEVTTGGSPGRSRKSPFQRVSTTRCTAAGSMLSAGATRCAMLRTEFSPTAWRQNLSRRPVIRRADTRRASR
jgi:protocatechuate 3,4-dioxygenase beta subunit